MRLFARISTALFATAAFAAVAVPASAGAASSAHLSNSWQNGHSVFIQTNSPAGNEIDAFNRGSDGRLSLSGTYKTGGTGASESGAVVDSLASQNSLVYDESAHELYAVNAGSDTISVFAVLGQKLFRIQVLSSGGEFPVSIATRGNLLYVLNAGGTGSVQGYLRLGSLLYPVARGSASLGLDNTNPPNYLMGPGDIGFTPSGSQLIVTTKASGSDIDVFNIGKLGKLSAPVVNASATPVPFSFSWATGSTLVVAEAGASSVSTYVVNADGTLTNESSLTDGQAALCWIAADNGNFYVANAGSANLSAYQVGAGGSLSLVGSSEIATTTGAGPIDLTTSPGGRYLYSQDGGADAIYEYAVGSNGSLSPIGTVEGLTPGLEGIATD